ncbi:MAG: hypothetical protein ACLQVL_17455 [Terriglobia bacterium]
MGFSKEGVLRHAQALDDSFLDIEGYGMLTEDWNHLSEWISDGDQRGGFAPPH